MIAAVCLSEPSDVIAFRVPGIPVAKGRPRITSRGGVVRTFTPQKTVSFESGVAFRAEEAMDGRLPLEGPVHLTVRVELPVAQSWSEKKKNAALSGFLHPCGRPDIDNYVKSIADGGNGILWNDDAQIIRLSASKRYALVPGVSVEVMPL